MGIIGWMSLINPITWVLLILTMFIGVDVCIAEVTVVRVEAGGDVQAALDAAGEGDTVELASGVYHAGVVVRTRGVTLRAAEPGGAVLSNAAIEALDWERGEGDLYSAKVEYPVRWVVAGRRNMFGYDTLDELKAFTRLGRESKGDVGGPREGFVWSEGVLYVRLLKGADPREEKVRIHRDLGGEKKARTNRTFWSGWWDFRRLVEGTAARPGTAVTVEAEGVTLEGLRIELAPVAGVVAVGDGLTVRDCAITSTRIGIIGGGAADLTVENSSYDCFPVYEWARWGQMQEPQVNTRDAMQTSNFEATFVQHHGKRARIVNNVAWQCYDGMWPRGMVQGSTEADRSETVDNLVFGCADECVEFDSREPLRLRVHRNIFSDALVTLAISPVLGGDLWIRHNVVYQSPERGLPQCTLLKFDCPWGFRQEGRVPTREVHIEDNMLINTRLSLYWTGDDHRFEDCTFDGNVVDLAFGNQWKLPGWEPGVNMLRIWNKNKNPHTLANSVWAGDLPVFRIPPPYGAMAEEPRFERSVGERTETDAGEQGEAMDLRLRFGAGDSELDWLPLRVGPRWDREADWRQFLSPSLRHMVVPAGVRAE